MTRSLRGWIVPLIVLAAGLAAVSIWLRPPAPVPRATPVTRPERRASAPRRAEPDESPLRFTLMTEGSGVDFHYYGAPTPRARMTEQNGGGVALFDFDLDGQLDLFLVNGSSFERPAAGLSQSNRLYRASGAFQYRDATSASGLLAHGFGMGVSAGDYDNDGFTDLFVACYGRDRLWRNNGDGTFSETTGTAGVGNELWGTSPAWADLDGDGLLDLFVANYVEWSPQEPPCHPPNRPDLNIVCSPMERNGQANALYWNLGDGRFEEVGSRAGVSPANGKGLAVGIADFDGDARLDIYVANDTTPKFLFRNLGGLRFEDIGALSGVAISSDGTVGAGMGVAIADFDHNGHLDLCVTNFRNQVKDVFANLGEAGFVAMNASMGVDLASRSSLSFGIVLADFDLDAWPDLFIANGHIWDLRSFGPEYEYEMRPQVLWNRSGRRFTDASGTGGAYFSGRWLARAAAVGDLDGDGDPDLVVSHLMAPPALLRNDSRRRRESVRLKLIGTRATRLPLGTSVTVTTAEGPLLLQVPAGGSFQSSLDPCVLVAGDPPREIRVDWPGGEMEIWREPRPDAQGTIPLIQGTGEAPAPRP